MLSTRKVNWLFRQKNINHKCYIFGSLLKRIIFVFQLYVRGSKTVDPGVLRKGMLGWNCWIKKDHDKTIGKSVILQLAVTHAQSVKSLSNLLYHEKPHEEISFLRKLCRESVDKYLCLLCLPSIYICFLCA